MIFVDSLLVLPGNQKVLLRKKELRKMPITKIDMVNMLYSQLNLPRKACINIMENFFEIIKSELEKSNPVMISGFGKWTVRSKRERTGRNPQTGEEMTIKARKVITFKGSPNLINTLNQ